MAKPVKNDDGTKKQSSSVPSLGEKGTGEEPEDPTPKTPPGFKTKEGKSEKKKRIALENEAKAARVAKLYKAEAKKLRLQFSRPLTVEEDTEIKERAALEIQRQEDRDAYALDDFHVSDVEEGEETDNQTGKDDDQTSQEGREKSSDHGPDPSSQGKIALSDLNPLGEKPPGARFVVVLD